MYKEVMRIKYYCFHNNNNKMSMGKIMFDEIGKWDPNKIVMIDAHTKKELTYGQLKKRSIQFAIGLINSGINIGDKVLLMSENSIEYPIYVLACMFIGATICPVNPSATEYEFVNIFNLIQPNLILCSSTAIEVALKVIDKGSQKVPVILIKIEVINEHFKLDKIKTKKFQPIFIDAQSDCIIFLSSGTTGLSKGVVVSNQNLSPIFGWFRDPTIMNMSEKDTSLGLLPFFHILGMDTMLTNIYLGVLTIVLKQFKANFYLETMSKYKITKSVIVPPLAVFLAKNPLVDNYNLSSLKVLLCGAAPLSEGIVNQIQKRLNIRILQTYGLTETNLVTFEPYHALPGKSGSCGILTVNTKARVIDVDSNEILGPCQKGELLFKGACSFKEYLGNSTATKETIDDNGYVHTGDIGYYDEDGYFFIIDRLKEMIKYKGLQVAPAELEGILLSHKCVKDAAVIGIPDERAGELPFAYVVKQSDVEVTTNELQDYVASLVSHYKRLAGGIEFIDKIPKNPSGKILRRKLRQLYNLKKFL